MKKFIQESMEKEKKTEEEIKKYRHSGILVGSSGSSTKENNLKVLPPSSSLKEKK